MFLHSHHPPQHSPIHADRMLKLLPAQLNMICSLIYKNTSHYSTKNPAISCRIIFAYLYQDFCPWPSDWITYIQLWPFLNHTLMPLRLLIITDPHQQHFAPIPFKHLWIISLLHLGYCPLRSLIPFQLH